MKYLIGLDGGGTKTKCVITDFNLNVLFECSGGPSNFLMLGTEEVSKTILNLITECKDNLKIEFSDVESIVIGTTGAGRRSDAELLENAFNDYCKNQGVELKDFGVESDARIALEGAFAGQPGSILIAGTGSIMFGKDRNGVIHRVGGFGRFIGDEGSGYMIGRKGLISVAKHFDGRGTLTLLTKLLDEKFNIKDPASLITEIYKNKFDIASVTPLVIEAANRGDEICMNIIEEESEELIEHIQSMINLLKEKVFKLSLIGSTITTDNLYANIFKDKVKEYFDNVEIIEPIYPPAIGAALMAKERVV